MASSLINSAKQTQNVYHWAMMSLVLSFVQNIQIWCSPQTRLAGTEISATEQGKNVYSKCDAQQVKPVVTSHRHEN